MQAQRMPFARQERKNSINICSIFLRYFPIQFSYSSYQFIQITFLVGVCVLQVLFFALKYAMRGENSQKLFSKSNICADEKHKKILFSHLHIHRRWIFHSINFSLKNFFFFHFTYLHTLTCAPCTSFHLTFWDEKKGRIFYFISFLLKWSSS